MNRSNLVWFTICSIFFAACGDSGTTAEPNGSNRQVSTMDDLLNCTANLEGETYLVTEQKNTYICVDGEWLDLVPTMDDLFYCTENREGKTVYVTEQNSSFVCKDGTWESMNVKSSSSQETKYTSLVDWRDGQIYKTVTIGTQTWMAENLNYETANSYCGTPANCTKYGRLYTWKAATTACPDGWHLPTEEEFETLFTAVGGKSIAGQKLKSTTGWTAYSGIINEDAFAFSALPAGDRLNFGDYYNEGNYAFFWSSTEDGSNSAYYMVLGYDDFNAYLNDGNVYDGFSVRCLKDDFSGQISISSSGITNSSSSASSSSQASSSSSIKVLSSDSVNADCGDLWCGLDDDPRRVKTGSENDSAGYWFAFNDEGDGGNSNISFPSDVKPDRYGYFFGTLAEAYGGIKGSFTMGDGYEYPYVGFSFNLVSEKQEGMDIADWGGVCLVYQSSVAFSIELGVENEKDVTGLNNYRIHVPRSVSMTTADFPWHKFKQESGWGEWVDQDTVLSKTAQIKLVFRNFAAGVSGEFLIQSIGRYGTCSNASNSYLSSSSVAK